jgi:beta-hydroxylase
MIVIVAFVIGSMTYAYKYRGHERFDSLREYLRKGWPLFTPLNCLLYMFTEPRARGALMNPDDFRELDEIKRNWRIIREEALNLHDQRLFEATSKPGSDAYYDIGFRTFFKYGWSKFYLRWYGYTHHSAKKLCPRTVEILEKIPAVNGAMLSLLPVGSQLTRHLDPLAVSLRYHLGLSTPNDDRCFINVDGHTYSWRDGEVLMFDETYLHFARNDTGQDRLILMCDIERPMNVLGRIVNFVYRGLARWSVVPNLEGDKRGLANAVFTRLAPVLRWSKSLKQTNRRMYLTVKYAVNSVLIVTVFVVIAGFLSLLDRLARVMP